MLAPCQSCPVCGSPIPDDGLRWSAATSTLSGRGRVVTFSKVRARIFNAVWRARHSGGLLDLSALTDIAYADDPGGGPMTAGNSVACLIYRMNRTLAGFHLRIYGRQGRREGGYRLVDSAPAESRSVRA